MTEEEQEAESHRYSDAIKVLPLSSGRIAMLGPRNELYMIVATWAEVCHNVDALRTAFKYVAPKNDRLEYRRSLGLPKFDDVDL